MPSRKLASGIFWSASTMCVGVSLWIKGEILHITFLSVVLKSTCTQFAFSCSVAGLRFAGPDIEPWFSSLAVVPGAKKNAARLDSVFFESGAGRQNRTDATSLEDWSSTTKLYPRSEVGQGLHQKRWWLVKRFVESNEFEWLFGRMGRPCRKNKTFSEESREMGLQFVRVC